MALMGHGTFNFRGEWPSGLRRYTVNQMDAGSNPTRHLAGALGPNLVKMLPVTLESNQESNVVINISLVRLPPRQWPKVGFGAAKKQLKKNSNKIYFIKFN